MFNFVGSTFFQHHYFTWCNVPPSFNGNDINNIKGILTVKRNDDDPHYDDNSSSTGVLQGIIEIFMKSSKQVINIVFNNLLN